MKSHIPPATAAPLCPAGHLPHKGGDRLGTRYANHIGLFAKRTFSDRAKVDPLVISPLVGGSKSGSRHAARPRQAGRAEGGNSTRRASNFAGTADTSTSKEETR